MFAPMFRPAATVCLVVTALAAIARCVVAVEPLTVCENDCSNHGVCIDATRTCACHDGWGSATDIATYKAPDCSLRVCPAGRAWIDVPTSNSSAHAFAECSNAGICNRRTGTCVCFDGFEGDACHRSACPRGCSGHGRCVSMRAMATMEDGMPISPPTTYAGEEDSATWDERVIYGCVCDASWPVGLGAGQVQQTEWFGASCDQKRCPGGDDPMTKVNETDCTGVNGAEPGNLCHVECSNRGVCNHVLGECQCFAGFTGSNCAIQNVFAT